MEKIRDMEEWKKKCIALIKITLGLSVMMFIYKTTQKLQTEIQYRCYVVESDFSYSLTLIFAYR